MKSPPFAKQVYLQNILVLPKKLKEKKLFVVLFFFFFFFFFLLWHVQCWKPRGWWLVDIYFPLRDDCSCMYLLLILLTASNTGNQPNLRRFGCSWFLYIITALCSSFTTNRCLCAWRNPNGQLYKFWREKVSNMFVMSLLYGKYPNTELYLPILVLLCAQMWFSFNRFGAAADILQISIEEEDITLKHMITKNSELIQTVDILLSHLLSMLCTVMV